MCYHPFIFSSFPLFIWAFSFLMECFQNKTLEQGRKRETASETNIPPRSDRGGGKRETLRQKKMRLTVKFLSSVTVRVSFLSFSCERSFSVTGSFVSSLNL